MKVIEYSDVLVDKRAYARVFSEGNKNLESLLNFCFDNNIETFGCCKGHVTQSDSYPYIAFAFSSDDIDTYSNLISLVSRSKAGKFVNFRLYKFKNKYRLICNVVKKYCRNPFVINKAFMAIYEGFKLGIGKEAFDSYYKKILAFYTDLLAYKSASTYDFTLDNISSDLHILLNDKLFANPNLLVDDSNKLFRYLMLYDKKVKNKTADNYVSFTYFDLNMDDIDYINSNILKKEDSERWRR